MMDTSFEFVFDPAKFVWGTWLPYFLLFVGGLMMAIVVFRRLLRNTRSQPNSPGPASVQVALDRLAATSGVGALAGGTIAVTLGGPGALLWMRIATLFAVALSYAEAELARRIAPAEQSKHPHSDLAAGLFTRRTRLTRGLADVQTLLLPLAALFAGAVLQGEQADAALAHGLDLPRGLVAISLGLALAILLLTNHTRPISVFLVRSAPILLVVYVVLSLTFLVHHGDAAIDALHTIAGHFTHLTAAVSGASAAGLVFMMQHGVMRATLAGEAGLGITSLTVQRHNAVRGSLAVALLPIFTVGVLGTTSGLVVMLETALERPSVADAKIVPLERHESRGLRPSRLGQTIVLPTDTKLQSGERYPMVLRANPRGHRMGRLLDDQNAVMFPLWEIAQDTDTIVLRDRDPARAKNAGYDVRIPCVREVATARDGTELLKLTPADETLDLRHIMRVSGLDGPFVVLDDFHFVGKVGHAVSPDSNLGEHLAMIEEARDQGSPYNPILRELFTAGYRGPYVDDGQPRPPYTLLATPEFSTLVRDDVASRLRLRMVPPARGLNYGWVTPTGDIVLPAWDFLAKTRTVVFRHAENTDEDIFVPVTAVMKRGRLHLRSEDSRAPLSSFVGREHYEGPFLLTPEYEFDVEVHTGTRLPADMVDRVTLIPLHASGEPMGNVGDGPYDPHPGEVLESGMLGPFVATDAADRIADVVGTDLGWSARLLVAVVASLLGVAATLGWLAHCRQAFRSNRHASLLLGALVALFYMIGPSVGFVWARSLADAAVGLLALPVLIGLVIAVPRLLARAQ